jgi:hypothetical protein
LDGNGKSGLGFFIFIIWLKIKIPPERTRADLPLTGPGQGIPFRSKIPAFVGKYVIS